MHLDPLAAPGPARAARTVAGLAAASLLLLAGCTSTSTTAVGSSSSNSPASTGPVTTAAPGATALGASTDPTPGSAQVSTPSTTPGLTPASVPYRPPSATAGPPAQTATGGATGTSGSDAPGSGTSGSGTVKTSGAGATNRPPTPSTTQSPGNIDETVPTSALTTAPPVPITGTANFGGHVTGRLSKVTRTTLTAQGPGEFAGPGVVVTIVITNGSAAPVDLSAVTVTIAGANGVSAIPVQSGNTVEPFSGSVAPGASASGVYVFSLHSKPSNPVAVAVNYSVAAPVVAFTGSL